MRCYCCNRPLNDYESTLKSVATEEYLDMCRFCVSDSGIEVVGRDNLNPYDDAVDDYFWDDIEVEEEVDQDNWGEDE